MKKILLGFAFLGNLLYSYAQSGNLDPSFGVAGIVKADFGARYKYNSAARQVLTQPDGSIYIICNYPTVISKRLANGAIDSGYGRNGYSSGIAFNDVFAAFQPDGKIVIVGNNYNSAGIARFTTHGTLDSTFGRFGIQYTTFIPNAVCVKSNGNIVITEPADSGFIVHQFNTVGGVDYSFNGTGKATAGFVYTSPPPRGSTDPIQIRTGNAKTLTIQADGKIVVGGFVSALNGINSFGIVRFNINGSIDNTFSEDGKQTTLFENGSSIAYAMVLQTDGKILLAGYTIPTNGNAMFALARYNVNGTPDNSFNGVGKQQMQISNTDIIIGNSVALESNGKIVVGGYTFNGTTNDFAVARFNTSGTTDNTFGNAGLITTDFNTSEDYAGSVSIQRDDKILIAGYSNGAANEQFSVARYNTNGTLDNTFGANGRLTGDYQQGNTVFNASVLQPDGKLLVAGTTWNGTNTDFAIARYNINGSPDNTFGNNGYQVTDLGQTEEGLAIALQPDGKIVVAGNCNTGAVYKFAVTRFTTNGTLDITFNGTGKLVLPAIGMQDLCQSVAVQKDNKIVLAGFSMTGNNFDQSRFAIARLNTNGSFDNTFSGDGKQLTDFSGGESFATALVIQNNDKIIVTGRCFINNQNNFCLARYNIDGSLDNTFSGDGKQMNLFGMDDYYAEAVALQKDGKIVLAGFSEIRGGASSAFHVARYNTNGDLDNTFNNTGFQSTSVGSNFDFAISIAIKDDGRIAVGGTNDNFAIVLYKTNGSTDSTFDGDGIKISPVAVTGSIIQSLVFDLNKLYAVGYGQYPGTLGVIARYLVTETVVPPATLAGFTAILQGNNKVYLQWQTVNENNLAGFTVQRSTDNINFITIGYVTANGTNQVKTNYSIFDKQPLKGTNYYKLIMVDRDGKFRYSNTVAVNLAGEIFTFQISPNPAKNIVFVTVSGESGKGQYLITDMSGRTLKESSFSVKGNTTFPINVNGLPNGTYNLQLYINTKSETKRFIKE